LGGRLKPERSGYGLFNIDEIPEQIQGPFWRPQHSEKQDSKPGSLFVVSHLCQRRKENGKNATVPAANFSQTRSNAE
jgi:hypothetical protein